MLKNSAINLHYWNNESLHFVTVPLSPQVSVYVYQICSSGMGYYSLHHGTLPSKSVDFLDAISHHETLMSSSVDHCSTVCTMQQELWFVTKSNGIPALLWADYMRHARPMKHILTMLPIQNNSSYRTSCSDTSIS